MTKSCKVSVVIPCFNHGQFLAEAVASVTAVKRSDTDLIVVDDGSTDVRTRDEVDKIASSGIKVISQENRGLAAARNNGIRASQGEYIFPLDADDRLHSGWIDHGIEILKSNPNVGIVYGDAQCFGNRTDLWQVGPFDRERLLQENYIHASAFYRRSVWEQNGGYDGTMPVQGLEDWDMWLGALEHGWQFAYIPQVFFDYRQHEQSMITRARGFKEQIDEYVGRKHGLLYRQAWLPLVVEHQSVKATVRNLSRLLRLRLKQKLMT